ncbi:AAA family ATPase [Haliangium sp.]|uniref:AAA family ATPase n=1 Tax=Haliangium sp. TaxID=2663208 RepID=UPI003D09CFCB
MRSLLRIEAKNYGCLDQVAVDLAPLSVLVGPNGSGKSTLLDVIQFLGDAARDDLGPAVDRRGGFDALHFRGRKGLRRIELRVEALVTSYASESAPDAYTLGINKLRRRRGRSQTSLGRMAMNNRELLRRTETFSFKRRSGPGRRLTIEGSEITVAAVSEKTRKEQKKLESRELFQEESLALSTLPRLAFKDGGEQVAQVADLFKSFRVFDVNVQAARRPVPTGPAEAPIVLAHDASNLSEFLYYLSQDRELFARLSEDARAMIPGLHEIHFRQVGGAQEAVVIELEEHPLPGRTPLAAASFGTIRALSMLALLYDPAPPMLTCVEEIDHGFHPHLFDRLVELLRRATARTQLIIATHSPALVNRLRPDELIVCERDLETGGVRIPAITSEEVEEMIAATEGALGPGELWFSGSLGGVP